MIATLLRLTRADLKALKITDPYSIHRVVYSLFDDVRTNKEKATSVPSGFLYVDKGGAYDRREILIVSDRVPNEPDFGKTISKRIPEAFLDDEHYRFEVVINPTKRDAKSGKTVAILGEDAIRSWFYGKSPKSWGFSVKEESLLVEDVHAVCFKKGGQALTLASAKIVGELCVIDRELFLKSFKQGIGRARAFGFGLLQLDPRIK